MYIYGSRYILFLIATIHFRYKIKLLTFKRKLYLDKQSRIAIQRRTYCYNSLKHYQPSTYQIADRAVWIAPAVFSIAVEEHRAEMLVSLRRLRKQIAFQEARLCLDFSATEKIYAEGGLIFVAELRRLLKYSKGNVALTCVLPNNNKVAQVLKQIGVLDLLGVTTPIVPQDDDVVNWRCAYGEQVLGEKYDDILEQYDGEIAQSLTEQLYTGITEAMTNVINHAYDLTRLDGLSFKSNKDWWMFSQENDGFLSIVFCDLGAGIPRTLPDKNPNLWKKIRKLGQKTDSYTIKYAVTDSISRTNKSHRGKGLGQIVRVVENVPGGRVHILSNFGCYAVEAGSRPRIKDFRDNIMGTLIYWRIPLPRKE